MLNIIKVQNKESYIEYGTPVIKWYLVTFENGTKGAYQKCPDAGYFMSLMPMKLAIQLVDISDSLYTMQSILHKHDEFKKLKNWTEDYVLWDKGNGKVKLEQTKEVA